MEIAEIKCGFSAAPFLLQSLIAKGAIFGWPTRRSRSASGEGQIVVFLARIAVLGGTIEKGGNGRGTPISRTAYPVALGPITQSAGGK